MAIQVFGSVSTGGGVYQAGSCNWASKAREQGHYEVTFDRPLDTRPVVLVTGIAAKTPGAASGNTFVAYEISEEGFTVQSLEAAVGSPTPVPGAFAFVAIT